MNRLLKLSLLTFIGIQLFLIDMQIADMTIKLIASLPFLFMGIWLCILLLFPKLEKKVLDNM